jgi:hypothetical protein
VFDDLRLSLEEVSVRHAEKEDRMLRKEVSASYVCEWRPFVRAHSLRGLSNKKAYEAQNRQTKLRDVPKRL